MASLEPMKPIYLPKRQGEVPDEDYDTGIVQNEENLNQNINRLYSAVVSLQSENDTLRSTVQTLRNLVGGS